MSDSNIPESQSTAEADESFDDILSRYERNHSRKAEDGSTQLKGTVLAVSSESVLLDIGFKTEGILPLAAFQSAGETVKPGDKVVVTVKGRGPEGYYELARGRMERPKDWPSLEKAFTERTTIAGTVTG